MRHTLPTAALLALLLSACASAPNLPPKAVNQSGALKVHPGLMGQTEPQESRPQETPAPTPPAAVETGAGKAGNAKAEEAGQLAQGSIYFDLKSAEIKPEFKATLQAVAAYLARYPKARIRIEGNADERGPDGHNHKLGLRRAENVRQALMSLGVAGKQIRITSLGATNPKRKGHDEESWAENRRADIVYEKE